MKIICFIASLFLSIGLVAQNKYALLIGIGNYPKDSGWNLIHGDNDIHIIKGLLVTQGFNTENIATLTNETATKDEIISNFNSLHERVQLGDVVYIHFSGRSPGARDDRLNCPLAPQNQPLVNNLRLIFSLGGRD